MFQVGQKIVRVESASPIQNEMIKGHVYTVSWVSLSGVSCKVEEIPNTSWQTSKFAAAEGYELPAEPKTILYNCRSLPSAHVKI